MVAALVTFPAAFHPAFVSDRVAHAASLGPADMTLTRLDADEPASLRALGRHFVGRGPHGAEGDQGRGEQLTDHDVTPLHPEGSGAFVKTIETLKKAGDRPMAYKRI